MSPCNFGSRAMYNCHNICLALTVRLENACVYGYGSRKVKPFVRFRMILLKWLRTV